MPLSWNEIKSRAVAFSREWAKETSEDAEAKSFWDAFFDVFGVTRRRVASFEAPVKKSDGQGGFIDLLWKGVLVVEHKSRGRDLDRAFRQALDYFLGLAERDLPRHVLVSDFARFRLHDLDVGTVHEFPLADLYKNVRHFGFVAGYQTRSFGQEDPVNVKAAEKLGKLHDLLKASGYSGHPLEIFLVRILFCLFAEDTSIFWPRQFADWLAARTAPDGSDAGSQLAMLFETLNTPDEKRQSSLDASLAEFRYVNGRLFEERLPMAAFDRPMRETLLDCAALDWSRISPAIFGSLFQSIMDERARRNLGAHYTTETNILKCLRPLFLDALHAEFERIRNDRKRLPEFQKKLASLRLLDPAWGCGNFLVVAYRELRLLEVAVASKAGIGTRIPFSTTTSPGLRPPTLSAPRSRRLRRGVLDARAAHPGATLADLYDPLAMPPDLVIAHAALDRAVDAAYGKRSFPSESDRVAFLFERYRELVGALPAPAPKKPARRRKPGPVVP